MSWTLDLLKKWTPQMTLLSAWRYRGVILRQENPKRDNFIRLKLKRPFNVDFTLREGSSDFSTWDEIFLEQVYRCVLQHVPECKTIVDLGANIGLATLYFAKAYPDARIVSVEADAANFALLHRNVRKLIRRGRCQPIHAAAWNQDGSASLGNVRPGGYDLYRVAEDRGGGQKVEALSMQTILQRSGFAEVDLLKVDIEGAEVQLFQGDLSWLERVNAIAIEFHGNSRAELRFEEMMKGRKIIEALRHTVLAVRT